MAKQKFKTEISQLLKLIVNSLYSHKEIFLRELISNSSDALDKLKYLTLTDDKFKKIKFDPSINITFTEEGEKTLTVKDNGIGMNNKDLEKELGTIARSGTKTFLDALSGDAKKDANLIGQFGVGFYSCFMVAKRVEVITRKTGEDQAWLWKSDGSSYYTIDETERESFGTTVTLYLNEEGEEFASRWQIDSLVKKYSDHIMFPIFLEYDDYSYEEGEKKQKGRKTEQINQASALWTRPKSELTDKDYYDFYKTVAHDSEDPLHYLHTKAEGTLEYTTLFYIPKKAPFDLYHADYKPGVKLYVNRVFITDDDKDLMPTYLRFVKGIIDSEDLPLNVSREILQQNRVLVNIKNASVKKLLNEFKDMAENNPEKYKDFIAEYNRPLKEGLYQDFANRDQLLELVRYKTTETDGFTSLQAYKERMKEDQKAIYYITGGNEETLRNSPLLEAYKKKDIQVLIMDDDIDEIIIPTVGKYQDFDFKAVNKSGTSEDLKDEEHKEKEKKIEPLVNKIKDILGDKVKDVKVSGRLSDSPSCIVADENDPTIQMQHILKAMGQQEIPEFKPILEINPDHDIVKKIQENPDQSIVEDVSWLLFEQALLMEGGELKKPAEFVKRLNRIMQQAI